MNNETTFNEFLPVLAETFEKVSGKKFIPVPEKIKTYELLFYYFKGDKKFEELGYILNKGLYVMGPIGIGKTMMLKTFAYLRHTRYKDTEVPYFQGAPTIDMVHGLDIASNFSTWGFEYLNPVCYKPGLCIDDVGNEGQANHYGNKVDVVSHIIQTRYNYQIENHWAKMYTHITSNLGPDEMEEKYDARVRDRMKAMFNLITFDLEGKSMR